MLSSINDTSNAFQSFLLVLALAMLAGFVGFVLGGIAGLIGAVILTLTGIFFGTKASAKLILRMYKAQPIHPGQAPQLFEIYNELCRRAELAPYPKLYYIPTKIPNAFAVGTGEASVVAVTDGLMRMMNPRELAGILAHEITHVRCRDTSVLGLADIFSRTISAMSRVGLLMLLFSFGGLEASTAFQFWTTGLILFFSPTIAVMLQMALSRTREFNADRGAAELTGDSRGLASALHKLDRIAQGGFLKRILGPGMRRQQPAMLRTHPPTEDRIEALLEFEREKHENAAIPDAIFPPDRRIAPTGQRKVMQKPRYRIVSGIWR